MQQRRDLPLKRGSRSSFLLAPASLTAASALLWTAASAAHSSQLTLQIETVCSSLGARLACTATATNQGTGVVHDLSLFLSFLDETVSTEVDQLDAGDAGTLELAVEEPPQGNHAALVTARYTDGNKVPLSAVHATNVAVEPFSSSSLPLTSLAPVALAIRDHATTRLTLRAKRTARAGLAWHHPDELRVSSPTAVALAAGERTEVEVKVEALGARPGAYPVFALVTMESDGVVQTAVATSTVTLHEPATSPRLRYTLAGALILLITAFLLAQRTGRE